MSALESIGAVISTTINPLSTYLAEKIANRLGESDTPAKAVVLQSLIFTLIWVPIVILTMLVLGLCAIGLSWLFSFF